MTVLRNTLAQPQIHKYESIQLTLQHFHCTISKFHNTYLFHDPVAELARLSDEREGFTRLLQLIFPVLAEVEKVFVLLLDASLLHRDGELIGQISLRICQPHLDLRGEKRSSMKSCDILGSWVFNNLNLFCFCDNFVLFVCDNFDPFLCDNL